MSTLPIAGAHFPRARSGQWLASRSDGHRLHAGIDLVALVGTPVLAPERGTVVAVAEASTPSEPRRSNPSGWAGYGPRIVLLRGGSGAFHLLAHLGRVDVALGANVDEGEQLGTVGVTSTPHVHWEVRARPQPPAGAAVVEVCADPRAWFERGAWVPWSGECPPAPIDDVRTPRACRPSWRGPAPRPFPRPVPTARRVRAAGTNRAETAVSDGY